jgi:uncharacterized membrane protein
MQEEKPSIGVVEGTSAALVGIGVLVLALFPLAIPLLALTAVALIPLLVPVLALALVGAVLAAPALLVKRLSRHRRDALRTHPANVKVVGRELA